MLRHEGSVYLVLVSLVHSELVSLIQFMGWLCDGCGLSSKKFIWTVVWRSLITQVKASVVLLIIRGHWGIDLANSFDDWICIFLWFYTNIWWAGLKVEFLFHTTDRKTSNHFGWGYLPDWWRILCNLRLILSIFFSKFISESVIIPCAR